MQIEKLLIPSSSSRRFNFLFGTAAALRHDNHISERSCAMEADVSKRRIHHVCVTCAAKSQDKTDLLWATFFEPQLGRKVRQTLPTLLFADPAGGKVKKRAPPAASHMSLAIHFSNCNNKRLTLTNISLNIVNNIKNNNNRNRVLALLSSSF